MSPRLKRGLRVLGIIAFTPLAIGAGTLTFLDHWPENLHDGLSALMFVVFIVGWSAGLIGGD